MDKQHFFKMEKQIVICLESSRNELKKDFHCASGAKSYEITKM